MAKPLCIHGHFYQPPREDPWLDTILPEGSAAPTEHWNRRILDESYAPLAWARRLDGAGRIIEIMNCYEFISFNFGPTLLCWMSVHAPELYARVLEGDRKSLARLGHGNAIAQIYHHVIMPLATDQEKRAEIAWACADFEARFGRAAEGLWLSEAAVDTRTLDLLAQAGIRFTILAPRQAREIAPLDREDWSPAHEGNLDIRQPYLVELPQGRSIAVYFYDGPLSQAVAFEGLLRHGDSFWGRLASLAGSGQSISGQSGSGLLALATDGETYGHHFKFGEMALAHALSQARAGADGVELTNYAAYLSANPPRLRARIHEDSSWSCAHGVERWRADCGCATEHKPGWNQRWRAPLRQGLRDVKTRMDEHFFSLGATLFREPEAALLDYGRVLSGLDSQDDFARRHFQPRLQKARCDLAWRLLSMQKWALSSFASCAWFFDDLGRIEPLNALAFALRAMELAGGTGLADDLPALLLSHLEQARSNDPALGSGRDIWEREILPRHETSASIIAQALLLLWAKDRLPEPSARPASARSASGAWAETSWPGVSVRLALDAKARDRLAEPLSGRAVIRWARESGGEELPWTWEPCPGADPLPQSLAHPMPGPISGLIPGPMSGQLCLGTGGESCLPARDLPWGKRQALALAWARRAEIRNWERRLAEAALGAQLFLPFREAQTMQTGEGRWLRLWPALAWLRIIDALPAGPDLLDFLRRHAPGHPERELLCLRLGRRLASLLDAAPPEPEAVKAALDRAGEIGVAPDLRHAQDLWWEHLRGRPEAHEAGQALGFAQDLFSA